jgi:hypothetical protein
MCCKMTELVCAQGILFNCAFTGIFALLAVLDCHDAVPLRARVV